MNDDGVQATPSHVVISCITQVVRRVWSDLFAVVLIVWPAAQLSQKSINLRTTQNGTRSVEIRRRREVALVGRNGEVITAGRFWGGKGHDVPEGAVAGCRLPVRSTSVACATWLISACFVYNVVCTSIDSFLITAMQPFDAPHNDCTR